MAHVARLSVSFPINPGFALRYRITKLLSGRSATRHITLSMSTFYSVQFPTSAFGIESTWVAAFIVTLIVSNLGLASVCLFYKQTQRRIMILTTILSTTAALFLATPTTAVDPIVNAALNAELLLAPNFLTRENSLLTNSDWFFDFAHCTYATFEPGSVCNADKATWPVLTEYPITVTQLNLGPCNMLPAHYHRADNAVVATLGTTRTFMYPEDGATTVEQYLSPGQMTLFPRMSLHTMVNEGCTNNQLYSFLPNNDAGRLTPLSPQALWSFGMELVVPVLPVVPITEQTYNATVQQMPQVGTGAIYGLAECRQRCGLPPTSGGVGNETYAQAGSRQGKNSAKARAERDQDRR